MQKIIITLGFMICTMFVYSQQHCATIAEQAFYKIYNDVFDNINFLASHWQNNVTNEKDITKRMKDLDILANKIAEKLRLGKIPLKYLRDKDGNIVGYLKDENGDTFINAGRYTPSSKQISVNKTYLKEVSTEEMVNVIAHEVYHAYQANEVIRLQNNEYRDEYLKLLNQYNTAENDVMRASARDRIKKFEEKQEIIKEWERNFQSSVIKELEEYYQTITNNPNLANNPVLIRLQTKEKRKALEAQYNDMYVEKHANEFAETMTKVYKDKYNIK